MNHSQSKIHDVPGERNFNRMSWDDVLSQLRLVPNLISIARIVLIWPIAVFFSNPSPSAYWIVLTLIIVSYLTDYLDGFLARRLSQQSRLGLILDPVADKVWTIAMIFLLYSCRGLPLWIMIIIIARDIGILYINLRLYLRSGQVMSSDELGRKYMLVMGLFVIGYTVRIPYIIWLVYFLVVIAGFSWISYYVKYRKRMKSSIASV